MPQSPSLRHTVPTTDDTCIQATLVAPCRPPAAGSLARRRRLSGPVHRGRAGSTRGPGRGAARAPLRSACRHVDRWRARARAGLRDPDVAARAPVQGTRASGVLEPRAAQRHREPPARPQSVGARAQVLGRGVARSAAGRDRRSAPRRCLAPGGHSRGRRRAVPDQGVQDATRTCLARRRRAARRRRRDGGVRGACLLPGRPHRPTAVCRWRPVRRVA